MSNKDMVRVLFVPIGGRQLSKSRVRIYNYFDTWSQYGIKPNDIPWRERADHKEKWRIVAEICRSAQEHDVVYLYRCYIPGRFLDRIRKSARVMVWDFDDATQYISSFYSSPVFGRVNAPVEKIKQIYRRITRGDPFYSARKGRLDYILSACNGVIGGSPNLVKYASSFVRESVVAPTPIDTQNISVKEHSRSDPVVIGWIGKPDGMPYLRSIEPAFRELGKRYGKRVVLRIVSDAFPIQIQGITTNLEKWTPQTGPMLLNTFDIGIMPLTDDGWSRGKCGYKALQCMAAGLPVVVSPVGINTEIVKHGINGFHANSNDEWVEKLSLLIENGELRRELGLAGRKTVESEYSVPVVQERIAKFLHRLARLHE